MKRLESLQPVLKPGRFDDANLTFTLSDDSQIIPLDSASMAFLQLCNGTYSIKELCLLVYNRESSFSFTQVYNNLESWAHMGLFKNSSEISEGFKKTPDTSTTKPQEIRPLSPSELLLALRKVNILSSYSEASLKHIISVSEQYKCAKGQMIIQKGLSAEGVYVLLFGSVGVFLSSYQSSKPIATLPPFTLFGESAALSHQKRTADVVALQDSQILRIELSKVTLPELSNDLSRNLRLRLLFSQMIKTHPLFKYLPGDVVQLLLNGCRIEKAQAGKTVIQQGDEGQDFYFMLSGSVLVVKDRVPEATLKAGSYFGEMGGLLKQTRSASIVTETESIFLVLGIRHFISVLASNLPLAMEIEKMVHARKDKAVNVPPPPLDELSITEEITLEITRNLSDIENFDFSSPDQAEEE